MKGVRGGAQNGHGGGAGCLGCRGVGGGSGATACTLDGGSEGRVKGVTSGGRIRGLDHMTAYVSAEGRARERVRSRVLYGGGEQRKPKRTAGELGCLMR